MILDASSGRRGIFVREDDGSAVRWVRRYDTETGEFEAFRMDPELALKRGINLGTVLYRGRARLKFIEGAVLSPRPHAYAPAPSAPFGELREEVLKGRTVTPLVPIPGLAVPECEERNCHRPAEYLVAEAIEVEPEVAADGRACGRAVTVKEHAYCPWHFRAPTKTDLRGVERELNVATRPQ